MSPTDFPIPSLSSRAATFIFHPAGHITSPAWTLPIILHTLLAGHPARGKKEEKTGEIVQQHMVLSLAFLSLSNTSVQISQKCSDTPLIHQQGGNGPIDQRAGLRDLVSHNLLHAISFIRNTVKMRVVSFLNFSHNVTTSVAYLFTKCFLILGCQLVFLSDNCSLNV